MVYDSAIDPRGIMLQEAQAHVLQAAATKSFFKEPRYCPRIRISYSQQQRFESNILFSAAV